MPATCSPRNIIRPSNGKEDIRYHDGETGDIIETILFADANSASYVDTQAARCLVGRNRYETARNVWAFVKKNVRYRADRPGRERVKSPGALFSMGTGDCKSFSIAEGALLRALGIPYRFRFTAYQQGDFTHVYVVATIDGSDVILDAVHTTFDEEVPYYRKRDIWPGQRLSGLSGVGSVSFDFSTVVLALVGIAVAYNFLRA